MHSLNQVNKLVSCGRDPARSLPLWRGFLLIPLILVCFAFAPQTRAVVPAPDGGYPGFNTAEGLHALKFVISGFANTGLGWRSLFNHQRRASILVLVLERWSSTAGMTNTAVGTAALLLNDRGERNTAVGGAAMVYNDGTPDRQGIINGAFGAFALNE